MVRITDRPDMTLDVYRGRKTTMQNLYCMNFRVNTLWKSGIKPFSHTCNITYFFPALFTVTLQDLAF